MLIKYTGNVWLHTYLSSRRLIFSPSFSDDSLQALCEACGLKPDEANPTK